MRRFFEMFRGDQQGLSLLELTVVAAIIAILASLTAVAVTGTTSTTRAVTRTSDISEMQKAVNTFSGEHSSSYLPTTSSCAAGEVQTGTASCAAGGTATVDYEIADETVILVDIDGDGATTTTSVKVVAVDFDAAVDTKFFHPDFIGSKPSHADDAAVTINTGVTIAPWVVNESGEVVVLVSENDY